MRIYRKAGETIPAMTAVYIKRTRCYVVQNDVDETTPKGLVIVDVKKGDTAEIYLNGLVVNGEVIAH